MSLNFGLHYDDDIEIFSVNITHNLGAMAKASDVYLALWHHEELLATHARHITDILEAGLARLEANPARYKLFSVMDGRGRYSDFVGFVRKALDACKDNPNARIHTWV